MAEARIGSGSTVLGLDAPGRPDLHADAVLVTLEGRGLSARLVVHGWEGVFDILAGFFADMERSFRGWEGERVYESFEGDLRIGARHLGRAIQLLVRLGTPHARERWSVEAAVFLEPGEELRRAASDVAEVVRGSEG